MNRHRERKREISPCIPRIANADSRMHLNGNNRPDRFEKHSSQESVMETERAPLHVELCQKRTSSEIGELPMSDGAHTRSMVNNRNKGMDIRA